MYICVLPEVTDRRLVDKKKAVARRPTFVEVSTAEKPIKEHVRNWEPGEKRFGGCDVMR